VNKLGKYEIVGKIGVGGFGVVYKGYDPFIKRNVAIKTCSAGDAETRERFLREAEIAGNLQHRNIVTVFEFGFESDTPYLVQEFLSGEDLDHKIRRGDPVPLAEKIAWLTEIARGLDFAHGRGVIHRDIKPANVRILQDNTAKILDFGIAKLAQQQSTLTQAGVTLGTASYLAPEQIRGEQVDVRTDLFSFGVLAYELLTYEKPFRAQEISALFYKLLNEEPAPISSRTPGVPRELTEIVMRCLEKDPRRRWATTAELLRALERLARDPHGTAPLPSGPTSEIEPTRAVRPEEPTRAVAARIAARTPTPHDRTLTLEELEIAHSHSAGRPESFAMSPARLQRRGWVKWIFGAAAAGAAMAAVLALLARPEHSSQQTAAKAQTSVGHSGAIATPAVEPPASAAARATHEGPSAGSDGPTPAAPESAATSPTQAPASAPEPMPTKPAPPPPAPGTLVVPAAWNPDMMLAIGGRRLRLDQERTLTLPAGAHRLEFSVSTPDYSFSRELPLRIEPGQTLEVAVPIEKPGRLTVQQHLNTRPGTVRLDGQILGRAPIRGRWLAPGEHFLEVFALGGDPTQPLLSRSISIRSDVESVLTFDLDGKLETLVVEKALGAS